jgi:NADPH:quinone reductase-like Zn-dependent oxidoreductase
MPCNDAAGEVITTGTDVKTLKLGDRVAPVIDMENITSRESTRSWLAADEDGVLADYLIFEERILSILPSRLSWTEACLIPCAGTTAWAALEGFGMGKFVVIHGLKVTPEDRDALDNKDQRYWGGKYVCPEALTRCRSLGYLELVK